MPNPLRRPLQPVLWKKLEEMNQRQLAAKLGASPAAMNRMLKHGTRPTRDVLARARDLWPDEVPEVVETIEDYRHGKALANLDVINGQPAEARRARAAAAGRANRGRPAPTRSQPTRERHRREREANHPNYRRLVEQDGPRLTAYVESQYGRAMLRLKRWAVRRHVEASELQKEATRADAELGLPLGTTWAWWRAELGIRRGGRRVLAERYELVGKLMAEWPRTDSGRLSPGFWRSAAEGVGLLAEDAANLERAYRRWRVRSTS